MSIIKQVLDGDWLALQSDFEKKIADKIHDRIQDKKVEVLAKINNVSKEDMLAKMQ